MGAYDCTSWLLVIFKAGAVLCALRIHHGNSPRLLLGSEACTFQCKGNPQIGSHRLVDL